jgi:hypothetical protein
MRRRLAVLLTAALIAARAAQADCFVIVNAANGIEALTNREVINLFMGRTQAMPGDGFAVPFDLPRDSAAYVSFYETLTTLRMAEIDSYRARLTFSGRWRPPTRLADEATMQRAVAAEPGAIGYLAHEPTTKAVRTVMVLKDACQ